MYSKKKKEARKAGGGKGQALMEQMGMFPGMMVGGSMDLDEDDDDDGDLEAELLALAGNQSPKKAKAKPKKGLNPNEFDKMVADSLRDIGSDEDLSDTDDPDLLAELQELTADDDPPAKAAPAAATTAPPTDSRSQVSLLEERLDMYKTAEASAKAAGESSKVRRINRGVKTLQDLLKKAKSGRTVSEDDIPPPVASGSSKSSSKSSSEKTSPENEQLPPAPQPAAVPVFEPTISSYGAPAARPTELEAPRPTPKPSVAAASQPAVAPKPAVSQPVVAPKPAMSQPASARPQSLSANSSDAEKMQVLVSRRDQFKSAALEAKHANDKATAVRYIKTAKQFDQVIEALQQGKPIDLSQMPSPPPGTASVFVSKSQPAPDAVASVQRSAMQASANSSALPPPAAGGATAQRSAGSSPQEEMEVPELSQQDKQRLFKAPESAGSALEALQQRLAKYKTSQAEAQEQGNNSKAKRMGRITKQYEDAIKMYKAGKPVDFDELPCPPGFPPIPGAAKTPAVTPTGPPQPMPAAAQPAAPRAPAPGPAEPARTAAPASHHQQPAAQPRPKMNRQLSAMSRAEQQTIFLQERQLQFRKAALQAKRNGDMELAKKYLRFAKGLDQMITAATSGLPVDMSQIPAAPNSGQEDKFEFVTEECTGDRDEMYKKLEQDLIQQMKSCTANADSFTHLGDVASATKFDRMRQNCMKDLDTLRNAYKHGDPVPRFHYESRQFSMVKCCTDLGDNDLEINIIKGMNYGLPSGYSAKDMDTYVKYEFPYPNDDPQTGSTDTCKHTNMPEYNQTFKVQINRKSRGFLRLLKSSKQLKFDVYYKRGFLKGDKVLGSIQVKLQVLENECVIHECVDLMDGRKASGGKLEYKVRVRDPFVSKQVEEIKERWLVIDKFERSVKPQQEQPQRQTVQKPAAASRKSYPAPERPQQKSAEFTYSSMEVLKYEKQLLEQQIRKYQGRLNRAEEDSMRHKAELLQRQVDETKKRLLSGGPGAYKVYVQAMEQSQSGYLQEAKALLNQGNRDKATIVMNKKKLIEKEVETIRGKIGI